MKKVLTAAVAALTIATTVAASTSNAEAGPFWGWKKGYGYGIAAGMLAAGAFAATTYAYCERVPVYNRFGEVIGFRRVCGY